MARFCSLFMKTVLMMMVVTDIVLSMTSSKDASPGNTVVETVVTPIEDSSPVAPHHSVIGNAILRAAEDRQFPKKTIKPGTPIEGIGPFGTGGISTGSGTGLIDVNTLSKLITEKPTSPPSTIGITGLEVKISDVFWREDRDFMWADGCYFDIQDTRNLQINPNPILNVRRDDCALLCLKNPECSHFSWTVDLQNDLCYLKKGQLIENNQTISHGGARCGFITNRVWFADANNVTWRYNCDFSGQGIQTIPKVTGATCRQKCLENSFCDAFTWSNENRKMMCYLKRGNSPDNKPTDGLDKAECGYIPGGRPWIQDGNVFWKDNCDFEADYRISIGGSNYNSALRCVQECAKSSGCTHIRYEKKGKGCQFRKGSGSEVRRAYNTDYACGYVAGNNF